MWSSSRRSSSLRCIGAYYSPINLKSCLGAGQYAQGLYYIDPATEYETIHDGQQWDQGLAYIYYFCQENSHMG